MNEVTRNIIIVVVLIVAGLIGYRMLTEREDRSAGEKIGDAVDDLGKGMDKAARQMEDRTPGEKLGDAVKDVGDDIKRNTD
jgi:short subunit fatty acids transporter